MEKAERGHTWWSDGALDTQLAVTKQRIKDEQTYYDLLVKEAQRRGWAGYVSAKQFGG